MTGVIDDSCYQIDDITKPASEVEGPGEAGFSMLRLKDIARQRDLFSTIESFTDDEETSYYSDTENASWRSCRETPGGRKSRKFRRKRGSDTSSRFGWRSNSVTSYFKEFIDDRRFDFIAYKQALKNEQLLDW